MNKLLFRFSQYSSLNHSILQNIYSYTYKEHYIGYLLIENQTKSIISIDPGDFDAAFYNIKKFQIDHQCKFNYLLQTHGQSEHTESTNKLFRQFDDIQVYAGEVQRIPHLFSNNIARDLTPFTIGEYTICFIKAAGHAEDNYLIVVTHVTPTSTKIPVIFSGDTILVGSVGKIQNYEEMNKTIQLLKGFNDETLIFPGHHAQMENLLFAKTIDPENAVLNHKITLDHLIPTTLIEEKMTNPYFRFKEMNKLLNQIYEEAQIIIRKILLIC
ncbi:hypothetical protein pb186bvf_015729 [Paramecium bursaria]